MQLSGQLFAHRLNRTMLRQFFKCWHEEYEYWANDENAIREELHNNQYEDRLYYMDGRVYSGPLDDVA